MFSSIYLFMVLQDTMANIPSELGPSGDKQDVGKIYGALHSCISKIPKDQLRRVVHIAMCGQMHGVMFWKNGEGWIRNAKDQVVVGSAISGLYTWQDGRCSPEFLDSLPYPTSHLSLNTGYGCATIFWHLRNKPEFLKSYDR
jgi:sedoheptulokinase